jgi:uncharacterized protein
MAYASRIADSELQKRLRAAGAVLVEGAKACGKTETARQVANSEVSSMSTRLLATLPN